jgi:hypothetical protein
MCLDRADPQHLPAVVVALPAEIDMASADRVAQQFGAAFAQGSRPSSPT